MVSSKNSLCNQLHNSLVTIATCPQIMSSDDSVGVLNYRNPAIEGTTITFSCPTELKLTGSNTSTCMKNREWEPDPKQTRCKGKPINTTIIIAIIGKITVDCHTPIVSTNVSLNYSSTAEDSLLTFQCKDGLFPEGIFTARCYRNGSWIPSPSGHACATSSAGICGSHEIVARMLKYK